MSGKRVLAIVLAFVVAAAVTAGIAIIGSPAEERTRRLDTRRVEDLQRIASAVEVYHQRHGRVPASLEELAQEPGLATVPRDPRSGEPYAYRMLTARSYELCAIFDQESSDARPAGFWSHGIGTQCFAREIKVAASVP